MFSVIHSRCATIPNRMIARHDAVKLKVHKLLTAGNSARGKKQAPSQQTTASPIKL